MERTIAARIAALETSAPVPGVLVTGYARYLSAEGTLKRLGSAVTDDHGMIEIAYDLDEAATGPFSLGVLVTAPEGPMALPGPLYQTAAHAERSHPGAQEMFLVRIPDKALQGAQVEAPLVDLALPASAATVGHRLRASFSHQAAVAAEAQVLAKEHIGRAREQMNQLESAIRTQLQTGVRVAGDEGVVPAGRYVVMPADSVAAVTREVVEQGLERHFRDATRPGQLVLPPEQAASLVADSWPAADIEALLFGTHQAEGTALSLVRRDVLLAECRDRTLPVDRCPDTPAEGETQPSGETGDPSTPVEDPALPAEADHASILRKVQELIGRAGSFPGSLDDIAHRPDLGQVDARVAGFHLRSGPADTTAVFDYDTLQIAFDHVWREAFDEDLIDTAMDLYNEIVLLGGTPPAGRVAESDYLSMLRAEVRTLANASLARPAAGRAALRRGTRMGDHRGEPDGPEPGGLPPPRGHESRPGIPPARPSGGAGQPGVPPVRDHRGPTRPDVPPVRDHRGDQTDTTPADLLRELEARMREPYAFTVYAVQNREHSVNFGLITTYRQRWQPVEYQAGKLVKTVTLAPKEEISYSRREHRKRSRTEVSRRTTDELARVEESSHGQDVGEIVRAARSSLGLEISGTYKVVSGGVQSSTEKTSSETKRRIREAVRTAAQEVKDTRSVEVTVSEEHSYDTEESGKLVNPNDELPVTYLFYELQRRYHVSESIHKLTPVILVAQPVPAPHEITRAWILQHDWILRRGLLDPSFLPALSYLRLSSQGAELELAELEANLALERRVIDELKGDLRKRAAETGNRYAALAAAIGRSRSAENEAETEGYVEKGVEWLFGSNDVNPDAARLVEESSRDAYERAEREERDLRERLENEQEALVRATERYTQALCEHKNRELAVTLLRVHIKQNILHYMRLIWDHEDPDQRYFRLHQVRVPRIEGALEYEVYEDSDAPALPPYWTKPLRVRATARIDSITRDVTLAEIADLDNPLGYKGNYLVFPLRQANVLTKLMMLPYADAAAGLRDPDEAGNYSRSDFEHYVCCLKQRLSAEEFAALLPAINEAYQRILSSPGGDEEEVVVATGSLFIEALPGAHPILEDYKLRSRAADLAVLRADIRRKELENLRYAARIVEGELGDPDIDKLVQIQGSSTVVSGISE